MNSEEIEIAYAIKNCIEKRDDICNNLDLFNKALNLITQKMISEGKYNFPTNISQLITFLKSNNMNTYLNKDLAKEPLLNSFLDINENILKITDERNEEEKVQKIMKELLDFCRMKNVENESSSIDWEEIYRKARLFISNNYLIEKVKLDIELDKIFPYEVAKIIKKMYIKSNYSSGEMSVCGICKRPLDYTNEVAGCTNVCKYHRKKYKIDNIDIYTKSKQRVYKLSNGIYRYIVIPNIGEYRIYINLIQKYKDLEIILYPNIDEFDISISNGDTYINLDVKDHKNPLGLVKILKENSKLYKFSSDKYSFLVIPDHRVDIYRKNENKNYMDELNILFQQEDIYLKLIQEKNLNKKVEQIFGGLDE